MGVKCSGLRCHGCRGFYGKEKKIEGKNKNERENGEGKGVWPCGSRSWGKTMGRKMEKKKKMGKKKGEKEKENEGERRKAPVRSWELGREGENGMGKLEEKK